MAHARDGLLKRWDDPDAEVRQGLVNVATAALAATPETAFAAALLQFDWLTVALDCTVRGGGWVRDATADYQIDVAYASGAPGRSSGSTDGRVQRHGA